MELETVTISKQTSAPTELLSVISNLWDMQPPRSESTSIYESERIAAARHALRAGNALLAQRLLLDLQSPEALNLNGLTLEAMGKHSKARRMYQRALIGDKYLYAAELNLRRSFELWEYGESDIPFAL